MTAAKGCARPNAKTPSRIFYDCNEYKYSNHSRCTSHYIRQETLMRAVMNLLNQQLNIAVDMERLVAEVQNMPKVQSHQRTVVDQYFSICVKRRNMEAKLEQLLIDLTDKVIDRSEYDYMKSRYAKQYEELLEEEERVEADMKTLDMALNTAQKWIEVIKKYQKLPYIDRQLLDELVESILIYSDKRIKINLNYADPYKPLMDYLDGIEVMKDVG